MGQAATGFGKTVVSAFIAQSAQTKGKRVIFTVHRKNLIRQTEGAFRQFGIQFGYIAAGVSYDPHETVHIASIETLRRRIKQVKIPDLLVVDEAHMAASESWAEVVLYFREHGTKILGNSATPTRLDGKSLGDLFETIVAGPPTRWLMDNGFLSDYIAYAPGTPDLTEVHSTAGDYNHGELSEAMDKPSITGDAADHYKRIAPGTLAIAYCCSIRHSTDVAQYLNAAGIPSAHIDGKTPEGELQRIIRAFADRQILVLCNVELITTGFDLSAQVGREVAVETIISLRPTQSETLHLQMVGRGLRRKPRPAILLDHAGNMLRHGLPDEEREWSLTGRKKPARSNSVSEVRIRECERCYRVHAPAPICPYCGFVYTCTTRKVEEVEGELENITPEMVRKQRKDVLRKARTYDDLLKIAWENGHKPSWAFFTAHARGIPIPRSAKE